MASLRTNNRVLAIMPHPDDIEILCAGTLIRLREEAGCEIHVATMTAGDKGSAILSREAISEVRREEAKRAASVMGAADCRCLEFTDLEITFDNESRRRVASLLRAVNPFLIFTTPPQDYMFDHEITSQLVRDACFNASVQNYPAEGHPSSGVPYLYYSDAISGHDLFGRPAHLTSLVDISARIDVKVQALICHDSQRSWLQQQHGMDDYVESMKSWGAKRGTPLNVAYAEGFCQHLGHPHPQDDILKTLLNASAPSS